MRFSHNSLVRGLTLLSSLLFMSLVLTPVVYGDWMASGSFSYTNRLYSTSGWTGTEELPIRYADVQVYDLATLAVLGSGSTGSDGSFSFLVSDNQTRDVGVRVLASTEETPQYNFRVADDANGLAVYLHHDFSTDVLAHSATADVAFPPVVAAAAIGDVATTEWSSQIFNAFDMCALTAEWIAVVDGPTPAPLLTIGWNPNNGRTGSSYSSGSNRVNLSDDDGYDDANILHEVGHYVEDEYGRSRNTGGSHTGSDDDQDPRLSWSEGFATYVSAAVLNQWGRPRPDIYSDRSSFGTTGGFAYTFENGQSGGATQERAVTAALHDLIDSAATLDSSVGSDDDPLFDRAADVWLVLSEMRALQLPTTNMENFWDLWFELGLGDTAALESIFGSHHIDFFPDAFEQNNSPETAMPIGESYLENTFYHAGSDAAADEDWFVFSATAGTHYDIQVNGSGNSIFGRPDPEMFLIDIDNGALLAYNHDPYDDVLNTQGNSNAQQMAETVPRIYWRAPASKEYFVLLRHAAAELNITRYGTYQIRARAVAPLAPTLAAVAVAPMRPGERYPALLRGENFLTNALVSSNSSQITVTDVQWVAPEAIFVSFEASPSAAPGNYAVTVTQAGGSATLANVLVVDNSAQPAVVISEVSLGTDSVELRNIGNTSADLSGWQLAGRGTGATPDTYTFSSFSLAAGARVVINDGGGTDTATELFDSGGTFNWPWSNGSTGDISLVNAAGENIDYIRFVQRFVTTHQAPTGTGALWMQPEVRSPASGFTLSRNEERPLYRTGLGLGWTLPTMPTGSSGRENALDRFEDNDTPRRASIPQTGVVHDNLRISPRPSGADLDWFGVAITAGDAAVVRISFDSGAGNLDLELYAPGESAIPLATSATGNDEEVVTVTGFDSASIGGGLYRCRVLGSAGDTNDYSLEVHVGAAQPDCDGDGISDALAITSGLASDDDGDGTPDNCGPSITSIEPNSGPPAGGTVVVIRGSGFQPTAVPLVGGAPLQVFQFVNASQVVGITPPSRVGTADISVTTTNGDETLSAGFLYSDSVMRVASSIASPGDTDVPLSVTVDNDIAVTGYSFAIDFDSSLMQVTDISVAGTAAAGAPLVLPFIDNGAEPNGGTWGIEVVLDADAPFNQALPAGTAQAIAIATADISSTVTGLTSVPLIFVDQVATTPLSASLQVTSETSYLITTIAGTLTIADEIYRRGDCNSSGTRTLEDALFLLSFLFTGGTAPTCRDACDSNDDGNLGLPDVLALLNSLFLGAGPLPAPIDCGPDPSDDGLDCGGSSACP